jgi:hypothetical protein
MIRCNHCSNQIAETFARCPVCGTNLRASLLPTTAPAEGGAHKRAFARFALPAGSIGLIIAGAVRLANTPGLFDRRHPVPIEESRPEPANEARPAAAPAPPAPPPPPRR